MSAAKSVAKLYCQRKSGSDIDVLFIYGEILLNYIGEED
jgi:hypothetical protein